MKLLNIALNVGEFKDVGAGIYVDIGSNPKLAEQLKGDVSTPDGVELFAYIDFGVKKDADDSVLGELVGVLEMLLKTIPFQKFPGGVYHSHTVDVAENEDKKKVLRFTIFSKVDPQKMISPMIEGSGVALNPSEIISGNVKLELPFAIDDVKDKFRLNSDNLKLRFSTVFDVNRKLKDVLVAMKDHMPPEARMSILAFFVKGIEVAVNFANIGDLVKNIPEEQAGPYGRPSPGMELKGALAKLAQMDIGAMLPVGLAPVMAAKMGQESLYSSVKSTLTGLNRVHIQNHDLVIRVNLKGFDVVNLLPAAKK